MSSPCEGASKASYACLNKYNFDRDKCMEYFEAYRGMRQTSYSLTDMSLMSGLRMQSSVGKPVLYISSD